MSTNEVQPQFRVVAEITRRDIFLVSLRLILRGFWMWGVCLMGFIACLWSQWHSENSPTHWFHVVYCLAVFGTFWLAVYFGLALLLALTTILQFSGVPGVLCSHTVELRPEGLFESTSANQTLMNWSAIPRAIRTSSHIVAFPAWWLVIVVPRRAFADTAADDAFFLELQQRIRQGRGGSA